MPLSNPDQQHLRAAHGFIELGMFAEANAELEEIDPFCRHLPEVLSARVVICHALKKWELWPLWQKMESRTRLRLGGVCNGAQSSRGSQKFCPYMDPLLGCRGESRGHRSRLDCHRRGFSGSPVCWARECQRATAGQFLFLPR